MIQGNQLKLYYKKKEWLTPKHPLYMEALELREYYVAAVIMQARLQKELTLKQNFEFQRLVKKGMELDAQQIEDAEKLSHNEAAVIDYLYSALVPEGKNVFLIMDLYNVGGKVGVYSKEEREFIQLFARMLEIDKDTLHLLEEFVIAAQKEDVSTCHEMYRRMLEEEIEVSMMELKYYLMTFTDIFLCTQEELEQKGELRLVDQCIIREDIVLRSGMKMIMDHAVVQIYGNIALEGGELLIEKSSIIRKSGSHRACINVRQGSSVQIVNSDIDCHNFGMFLRAEDGNVFMKGNEIYRTSRGASVRFWGKELYVDSCYFHHCFSPEDGGALMIKGGKKIQIQNCEFRHCEGSKGGAVYGVRPLIIKNCKFIRCYAAEFGAAVYYRGVIGDRVENLSYFECFPEGEETIQYISRPNGLELSIDYLINQSSIIDCELNITKSGRLRVENARLYLMHSIRCMGYLEMKNVSLVAGSSETGDMIILEHSRGCSLVNCKLDGMGIHGGIFATSSKLVAEKTVFCNMRGGRAVFNALSPQIKECIFNFCQNGGVHCQSGTIEKCLFVNCRGKSGAAITMLGKRGKIANSTFIRCVSDFSGGAVDGGVGNQVTHCKYIDSVP